jgi:hypothetical protein
MEQNEEKKDFAGKNGFIWWTGIVEDRKDPLKLGRCRVRCVGWHAEDKSYLPTEFLPWALPSNPINHDHTYAPKEGDMVFGFFADGENAQAPIMLGIFPNIPLVKANIQKAFSDPRTAEELAKAPRPPKSKNYKEDGSGIVITERDKAPLYPRADEMSEFDYESTHLDEPTTSRIARHDPEYMSKTFIQERKDKVVKGIPTVNSTWDEPETKYDAKYPYNKVMETESAHLQEFDDTPGAERIHMAHRNGSFQEWFPNGDKVEKVTKGNYEIVMGDDYVYIMGKCNITVQGDAEVYVKKDAYVKIDGNVDVKVGGNYNEQVGGTYNVQSGGNMKFVAPRIDLNP